MILPKFSKSFLVLLFVTTFSASVLAQTPPSASASVPAPTKDLFTRNATPLDINNIPVLANLVKGGAKLYYLGKRSDLHGWFIVKDGQVQIIYVTNDGKTAIMGAMFTGEGEMVTSPQVAALSDVNKEIADLVNGTAKQQEDVTRVGSTPGGIASVPSGTGSTEKPAPGSLPSVTLSPGERLLQDLQAAAGVSVGHNENAQLMMVIDPNCSHCQATWRELREAVIANRVQVRLIPISNISADSTRIGAQLLQVPNPLEAWDKYVAGDKAALAGEPDSIRVQAINSNRLLIEKWNIQATPYLVYRAKDGRVKIVQGQPERMAAVLADLLK